MSDIPSYCESHDESSERRGIDAANHCWHQLRDPLDVCCWCGVLVVRDPEDTRHGQYRPTKGGRP